MLSYIRIYVNYELLLWKLVFPKREAYSVEGKRASLPACPACPARARES